MKFIQVDKKPEKNSESAGKVDFVEYMVHLRDGDAICSMWPNGATVKGRSLAVVVNDIKHAWDLVMSNAKVKKEFGIV